VAPVAGQPGRLSVTMTARDAGCAQGNSQLQSIEFTSLSNGTVKWPGPPAVTVAAPTTLPVPGSPASYQFTVVRSNPATTTVSLVVHDGCGAWPTFVGGSASAF
jgi:hypothetical protein